MNKLKMELNQKSIFNNKVIIYSLLIISVIFMISCSKDESKNCSSLNENDKLWIQYRHHDSIGFINNLNDSIIYYIASDFKSQIHSGGTEETYLGEYCYEFNSIRLSFLNPSSDYLFDWDKSFNYIVQKENGNTYVYGNGSHNTMNPGINCSNPKVFFINYCATIHDSLQINNEWIKDVYECDFNHYHYDVISKIFLNQDRGIVKIIFQDGQEFELFEYIVFNQSSVLQ